LPVTRSAGIAAAALAIALGIAACDSGDDPPPITGPARAVAATVESFERATARRDYRTICDDLFSAQVRAQAGGEECPALLRRTARDVQDPRIRITSINVQGRSATVAVRTRARGQAEAGDELRLRLEGGRWRIAALG
jgi:hypothetical protein